MLQWLRQKVLEWSRPASVEAETLYSQLANATRNPDIYHSYHIEDSFDGRFDTVCPVCSFDGAPLDPNWQ
jgi:hypothetical protein